MISPRNLLPLLASLLLFLHHSAADVGTATFYRPPYLPTACYGGAASHFPADNFFAAAGDAIWDNGAACGRLYQVKCLSSSVPRACAEGQPSIQVEIVDYASTLVSPPSRAGTTMVLSLAAFAAITNSSAGEITQINVDFLQ